MFVVFWYVCSWSVAYPKQAVKEKNNQERPALEDSKPVVPADLEGALDNVDGHRLDGIESDVLSEQAEVLVMRLRAEQERVRLRLDTIKEGKIDSNKDGEVSSERFLSAKADLNNWFIDLLEQHGYKRWPEHLDGIKLMLFNSFPPLSKESELQKLEDIIAVLEGHISMAENSELFERAGDLVGAYI